MSKRKQHWGVYARDPIAGVTPPPVIGVFDDPKDACKSALTVLTSGSFKGVEITRLDLTTKPASERVPR